MSLGILAHDEAELVPGTLQSLFEQTALQSGHDWEIVLVANGCSDRTAEVARAALERLAPGSSATWKVCELTQAGKSNAWNVHVHELSRPDADFLILMDADITFNQKSTLESLLRTLESDPDVWVATDIPIKDVQQKARKTPIEWLSARVSASPPSDAICGQLYCARAEVLRQIWMPVGLPVEDGFLRAMVDTHFFTTNEGQAARRIRVGPDASHTYEAVTDPRELLRHEKRLVIGTAINQLIFAHLWQACDPEHPAGEVVRRLNRERPEWVEALVAEHRKEKGFWLVRPEAAWRRLARLRRLPLKQAAARLPVAVVATALDLLVFADAQVDLNRGRGVGYW